MVLLILVVLWAVVLTPHFVRKWMDRRPAESIESFHHELHLLERTGPKLVPAAYRLETAYPDGAPPRSDLVISSYVAARPNLVLLEPVGAGRADADDVVDEASGQHYRRLQAPVTPAPTAAPVSAAPRYVEIQRSRTRRRRRDILLGLVSTVVLTGLAGIAHSLHGLWVLTGLAGVALVGFVGLAFYAQLLETQGTSPAGVPRRSQSPAYGPPPAGPPGPAYADEAMWDDEEDYELPAAAVR